MAPSSSQGPALPPAEKASRQSGRELDDLRHIVVGPDQARIARLEARLDKADVRAREVSRVLPDALVLSTARDERIVCTLQPAMEGAIHASVRTNPKVLADAIFPLMGPGIRKAISATIMGMIQSFNQLLNHSFSIQGLRWRIEAWRTGKPYAEIVLLHTLVYQVEQVFLIHRESGLVLQHVVAPAVRFEDPDLVSGMLTAIEDFVADSFAQRGDSSLDTLRMGSDRSVWIEQGGQAMLAAVIRGTPPVHLRHRLADTLADIQLKFGEPLAAYSGDSTAFEPARGDLSACLDAQFVSSRKRISPLLWLFVALVLVAAGLAGSAWIRSQRQVQAFVADLDARPGIVVTTVSAKGSVLRVAGLKDPLAAAPPSPAFVDAVDYAWRPYLSLEPELVIARARQRLAPPETVSLKLDGDTLVAAGRADHAWIRRAHTLGPTVAGVARIRTDGLVDQDRRALLQLGRRIEASRILFDLRASAIAPDQKAALSRLAADLTALAALCGQLGRPAVVRIAGHADRSGADAANLALSRARAEAVRRWLIDTGQVDLPLLAVGLGARSPAPSEKDAGQRARQRFVGFTLIHDLYIR